MLKRRFAVKPQKFFVSCTPTFRQREGEKIMTEFSLLGELILYVRETLTSYLVQSLGSLHCKFLTFAHADVMISKCQLP